jgi:23S rRNA (pseudouridine1915-N3)-methyltransferase
VKIYLYFIGKPKDPHINAAAEDYMSRVARYCSAEMRELRPDGKGARGDPAAMHPNALRIALDPGGKQMDSAALAELFAQSQMQGRDLVFLIGGHDGLPDHWAAQAGLLLSLSRLTLPHELARVLMAEQIYRALATLRGHPYPR